MHGGPSGFNNAPVTRTLMIACALFTILVGIRGRSSKLGWSYEDILKKLQIWKLILSVFAFESAPELIFGSYLLYYFRIFERQIGSNKYSFYEVKRLLLPCCYLLVYLLLHIYDIVKTNGLALPQGYMLVYCACVDFLVVFILFSTVLSLLLELLGLRIINDSSLNVLTSGPYGILFASFVPFFLDIPVTTRFRVFSFQFSDKTFIYGAGLQLLFSSWRRSLLPGICGILAGSFYRMNVLHVRKMKFPEVISSLFSRLSLPSTGSASSTTQARNTQGSVPSFASRQVEGNYPAPFPATIDPPEDSIATLVSMGFDRNAARQALIHARNDVTAATNILLEAQ